MGYRVRSKMPKMRFFSALGSMFNCCTALEQALNLIFGTLERTRYPILIVLRRTNEKNICKLKSICNANSH